MKMPKRAMNLETELEAFMAYCEGIDACWATEFMLAIPYYLRVMAKKKQTENK